MKADRETHKYCAMQSYRWRNVRMMYVKESQAIFADLLPLCVFTDKIAQAIYRAMQCKVFGKMQCIENYAEISTSISLSNTRKQKEKKSKNLKHWTKLNSSKCGSFISTSYQRSMCARNSRCMFCPWKGAVNWFKGILFLSLSFSLSLSLIFCTLFRSVIFRWSCAFAHSLQLLFCSHHQIAWTTKLNELHTMTWIALDCNPNMITTTITTKKNDRTLSVHRTI